MAWNSFKDLADRAISQKGLKKKIEESLVLDHANRLLIKFLSNQAKDKISAVYFKSGILTIAALDNSLLEQMMKDKDIFIASLNAKLEDHIVEKLNFLS